MNDFNRRILVVDDNESIHADFRKILCGGGAKRFDDVEAALFGEKRAPRLEVEFELEFASQGQEAFELVQRSLPEHRPYAMAFVDVRMPPGWDGIETIARIWKVDPHLQIAICTAYSDYSFGEIADRLGENPDSFVILKKPFDTIEVTQLANAFTQKWNLFQRSRANERSLRESEQRYRLLAEAVPGIVWTARTDGNVDYANERLQQYAGKSLMEVKDQGWLAFLHPEDKARTLERWNKSLQSGGEYEIEFRLQRAVDGAWRWHLARAQPLRDAQGAIVQWIGTATDIEDRKRAEAMLRQSQEELEKRVAARTEELAHAQVRFEHLLRSSPAIIYSRKVEGQGGVTFISHNVLTILGHDPGEFIGQPQFWTQHVHPDDIGILRTHRSRLLLGEHHSAEYRFQHKDGSYRWLQDEARVVRNPRGIPVEIVGSCTDITARREMEEALHKSQNRYRELIESQGEGVVLIDNEMRFTFANPAAEKILGVWTGRLVGRRLGEFVAERDKEMLQKQTDLQQNGQKTTYEIGVIAGNNERRHILITGTPQFEPDGSYRGSFAVFRDITERKKAEEALRQSEERIRLLVANVKDHSIIMLDPGGLIASWNSGAERIEGRQAHEIVGQNFSVTYPPEEIERGRPAQALQLATLQGHAEEEGWRLRKDGSRFWASVVISAVRDEAGSLRGFSKVTRDITERRQVEDRLRLQTSALEAAANGIVITDHAGQILWVNSAFTRLTGYSAEEAIGQNPRILKSNENDSALYRNIWETITSGRVWDGELINRRKDGTAYAEHMTITPVRGAEGQIVRFIAIKQDITDRKRAEHELRYQKILLESQNEASIDGILNVDANGRIIGFNGRFLEMMGIPRDLMKSGDDEPVLQHVVAQMADPDAFVAKVRQLYADRTVKSQDELHLKDGKVFDRYTAPVTGEGGAYLGRIWIFRDITERKRAEQERTALEVQLRHAQKLEAVGQLAAGIAHEINTPTQYVGDNTRFLKDSFDSIRKALEAYKELLDAVKNNSVTPELISRLEQSLATNDLNYLFEQIPAAIRETLEGIERVTKIVRAMKEFSHPGGKEKTPADLNKAIETTVTVARNEWKYVADLSLDLEPSLPTVPCFVGEFNQVILNLIVNAAHAIGDVVKQNPGSRGTITVKTRRDDDHVEIRVADTGTGIPESCRSRIFEPFFTTKDVGRGTGQGLSIVYGSVVKKHGGKVSFETEVGKGTTFILRLPITASPVPVDPRGHPAPAAPSLEPPAPHTT